MCYNVTIFSFYVAIMVTANVDKSVSTCIELYIAIYVGLNNTTKAIDYDVTINNGTRT